MTDPDSGFQGLPKELGTAVLHRALRKGGDFAELFVEDRRSLSLRLEDAKIEDVVSGVDRGSSVRVVRGPSTYFGYVDAVDELSLQSLAGRLSTGTDARFVEAVALTEQREAAGQTVLVAPESVDVSAKSALLRLLDETARSVSGEIRQVVAVYAESRQRVWVVNSRGRFATDDRTRVMVAVNVTAQRDGIIQTGRETLAHHGGYELFREAAIRELAQKAAEKAVTMLSASPAPAGRMPVILANGFGGVLFHEACGHGLEADYILKKTSVWEGKLGQRVAPSHVSAYDDGVGAGLWGSAGCDDEGTPCERTVVIEEGMLSAYLTDLLRGEKLGMRPTGNGRRQDYRHLPYPRMTNTYFGPGEASCGDIIADTPRALYAKSLSGGEVNPATGDFVFGVAEGYLIEKGRIGAAVRGATLIGSGVEVLLAIDAIADDLDVKAGMCGKEGQLVPVGSGQPTLRIRELTVGGTSL